MLNALYVDTEELKKRIRESGLRTGFICEKLGISRQGFNFKINGKRAFRVLEVNLLCELLSITDEDRHKIFCPK